MKSLLQAAALLSASAFASVIPSSFHPPHASIEDNAAAGSAALGGLSVLFSIPSPKHFSDREDELDLELKLDSSSLVCQSSTIVLNDIRLSPNPGAIVFHASSPNRPNVQSISASWDMSCLNGEVTLLSLHITEVDTIRVQPGFGFTLSFKQSETPEVLRLQSKAVDITGDTAKLQQWTEAQSDQELVTVLIPAMIDEQLPTEVQEQLRHLDEIKAQIARLHFRYIKQERRIFNMIKQDFRSCDGMTCIFHTAVQKAPEFFQLVKAHFRHRPDWSKLYGHPSSSSIQIKGDHAVQHGGLEPHHGFDGESPLPWDLSASDHPSFPDPFDPMNPDDLPPPPPPLDLPPQSPDHPPPPPPWRHHPHRPHFFHRHGPHRHPFFFSAGSLLFFVILASLLFKCVRAKTGLFRDRRRQRDRAARREERRNRAAYRRAAVTHRWHSWWSHYRQSEITAEYEEKRARIVQQENSLEDAMQSEIRDLRRAHEIVGDMMQAEQTRQRLHYEANFGAPFQPATALHGLHSEDGESRVINNSVPVSYEPPPPSYDQELEGDMTVVDGFSYTPSATDSTPESSVVDCNPRMSFETSTTMMK